MSRNVCVTAIDGQTGFLIAELLLSNPDFSSKVDSVVGLSLHPESPHAHELTSLGAKVVPHQPGRVKTMAKKLKDSGCDTLCLVPPAHQDKFDISVELAEAARQAGVPNVLLISSAGCDYADRNRQPRLREFIDIESVVLESKGLTDTPTGTSPCVIRAGFYAENLLLYSPQAKEDGTLPLPIGKQHKFAPVALGDVALLAAHVLTGKGEHGFDDRHRGQMMICTGPKLCAGEELATAAGSSLGVEMKFESISAREAKRVLKAQSDIDQSEQQYLLEYYSLVQEGKTNYIATTAFHDVTGRHPTEPDAFFKMYENDMRPKKAAKRKHHH